MSRLLNEPVLLASAIRAFLYAVIAFGPIFTADQIAAVMVAIEAALALITRALVTPNQLAEERVERGLSPTDNTSMPTDGGPRP